MSHNLPLSKEAEPTPVTDNARKLIIEPINPEMIPSNNLVAHDMTIHWMSTAPDFEVKVVAKINAFDDMDGEILRIIKSTGSDTKRVTTREAISYGEFLEVCEQFPDMPHLKKRRTEFIVLQNGASYLIKYDEFEGSDVRMIEVDVDPRATMTDEDLKEFDPAEFFTVKNEVTGNTGYTGYRIIETLQILLN